MNFEFFYSLTKSEAKAYLENFLSEANNGINILLTKHKYDVAFDFEIFKEIVTKEISGITTVRKKNDKSLPKWITKTNSYKSGQYEFSEDSLVLLLRLGYYLGQCFVNDYPNLKWSIGGEDLAVKNMPIISGFKKELELAPLLVMNNILRRIIETKDNSHLDIMIDYWMKQC